MNRLRDDVGEDPIAARGIAMLQNIAATPEMPEMKRKVWGAIQQHRLRGAAPQPMRRLRMAAAGAIVLCLAGTAGAVLSQRWILPGRARVAQPATTPSNTVRARTRASMASVRPNGQLAETAADTSAVVAAPAINPEGAAAPVAPAPQIAAAAAQKSFVRANQKLDRPVARASAVRRASLAAAAASSEREGAREAGREGTRENVRESVKAGSLAANLGAASARERTEVLDALVALRRDHDADRATRMLDGYLSAYPRGVLREEALVLSIEAADARGDGIGARQLARMYQASFPGGRFTSYAREHASADRP